METKEKQSDFSGFMLICIQWYSDFMYEVIPLAWPENTSLIEIIAIVIDIQKRF